MKFIPVQFYRMKRKIPICNEIILRTRVCYSNGIVIVVEQRYGEKRQRADFAQDGLRRVDAAGPGRSAEKRPDVRLPAAGAGQSAVLETATATGQPGAPVHGGTAGPATRRHLQPQVFPDGLFQEGTRGDGRRPVHAVRVQTASPYVTARGRSNDSHLVVTALVLLNAFRQRAPARLPIPDHAPDTVTHAHAPAVPEADVGRYHGRTVRGPRGPGQR